MYILFALISYVVGAIPTGWLLAYCVGISDITKHGSGNIGATNVGRILGLKYFIIVLFVDCFKAYLMLSMLHCFNFDPLLIFVSSIALLLGNSISFFLQGKGGKGIATSLGILLAYNPIVIAYLFCIWLPVVLVTHNVGISCVVALLTVPFWAWFVVSFDTYFLILAFFISIWGLWRHETNIRHYFISKKAKI